MTKIISKDKTGRYQIILADDGDGDIIRCIIDTIKIPDLTKPYLIKKKGKRKFRFYSGASITDAFWLNENYPEVERYQVLFAYYQP